MSKLLLTFLLSPTILSSALSLLLSVNVANAAEPVSQVTSLECQRTSYTQPLTCQRSQSSSSSRFTTISTTVEPTQQADEVPMLDFTDEESDTAVRLFGCDCLVCINAVRQSRGLPPVS